LNDFLILRTKCKADGFFLLRIYDGYLGIMFFFIPIVYLGVRMCNEIGASTLDCFILDGSVIGLLIVFVLISFSLYSELDT
jgi:hypothetical protein